MTLEVKTNAERAAATLDRDVLVVANAGSGKTWLLTEHYHRLLASGLGAHQILTFTFTEKAAQELQDRILARGILTREEIRRSLIGNIDQFCVRLLEEAGAAEGKRHQIVDAATELELREKTLEAYLRGAFDEQAPDLIALLREYGIKNTKRLLRDFADHDEAETSIAEPDLPPLGLEEGRYLSALENCGRKLRGQWIQEKEIRGWINFEDLEREAIRYVERGEHPSAGLLPPIRHILVDEFQDTSPAQIHLIEALRRRYSHHAVKLFAVGDPKQSIYRFRKVDQKLVSKVEAEILARGGSRFELTQNYRSHAQVIEALNDFTSGAFPDSEPSELARAENNAGKVSLVEIDGGEDGIKTNDDFKAREARWIASEILRISPEVPLNRIAVLYRSSGAIRQLSEELKRQKIAFAVRGGKNLFSRQEIFDCQNLISFLDNPEDDIALVGSLRSPFFLISDATLFFLGLEKRESGLWEWLKSGKHPEILTRHHPDEIPKLAWALDYLQRLVDWSRTCLPSQLLRYVLHDRGMHEFWLELNGDEDSNLVIEQWLHWLEQIEAENQPTDFPKISALLRRLTWHKIHKPPLADSLQSERGVQLLTIHAAKGLQFHSVYLVGMNQKARVDDALLKRYGAHSALKFFDEEHRPVKSERYEWIQKRETEEEREEEKRLLYVALSRAENSLTVTLPAKRKYLGKLLEDALGERFEAYRRRVIVETDPEGKAPSREDSPTLRKLDLKKPNALLDRASFSVSELETFLLCPWKHHFQYQEKISEQNGIFDGVLDNQQVGTCLHAALHRMNELGLREVPERWEELLPPNLDGAARDKIETVLRSYFSESHSEKLLTAEESYSELPFTLLTREGEIQGQIDRLVLHRGVWHLIDFKFTGQKYDPAKWLGQYAFQLKTYALAVQKILAGEIPLVEIHPLGGQASIPYPISREDLEKHEKELESILRRMKQPLSPILQVHEACFQCSFYAKIPVCSLANLNS